MAHSPGLELDHVFVWVGREAPEAALLEGAGLRLDAERAEHTGQGTASVFFSFENAYLELIWVTDPDEAPAGWPERSRWRETGASPFGLGLRRTSPGVVVPFPTFAYRAPWMRPGTTIEFAEGSEDLTVPLVFVVPPTMAVRPPDEFAPEACEALHHPLGVHELTTVRLGLDLPAEPSPVLAALESAGVIAFEPTAGRLLDLTFDGGHSGTSRDLRPGLPLRLRR